MSIYFLSESADIFPDHRADRTRNIVLIRKVELCLDHCTRMGQPSGPTGIECGLSATGLLYGETTLHFRFCRNQVRQPLHLDQIQLAILKGPPCEFSGLRMAFADGDRKTLKGLLSREVYEGFEAAIAEREAKGEVVKSTFVGIDKADIVHAEIKDAEENITVRIISQLISATYDKQGKLVDGDADSVAEVNDLWTFARDIRSRDPNWKLIATESEN